MLKKLKKYWIFVLFGPLFMIGEVSMDLIQPRLMSRIIDEGVLGLSTQNGGSQSIIIAVGAQMIGVVVLGGLFGVLSGVFVNICSQNFSNDLRKDSFHKIMELSLEQTDTFSTGSLITRVTNDITQVQNMLSQLLRGCVRTLMFFFGGIYCMMLLDISFGITVMCALPIVLAFIIYFILKANPSFKILQNKIDNMNNVMQENVSGARVVKAYVREEYEQKRFKKTNDELIDVQLRALDFFAFMTPIANVILNITIVVIIKMGAVHVQQGNVTPGSLMAAITYISLILHSVMMIAMIFQTISRGLASYKRIKEILHCEPVIKDGNISDNRESTNTDVAIEFKNVSFAYGDGSQDMVLKNINLTIKKGETVAILGGTGCGKSTFVQLIPRFYKAVTGEILVNNIPVQDYKLEELRDKIAIILQKSELFNTTIKNNIILGKENATIEELYHAANMAQAMEFIDSKEEGFETVVAERGASLSGGQKQRIAIARALLKNSEILIFDDATSALDLKTEARITEALQQEYSNVTKIIVAQRIASVMRADRIVVMENGKIAACAPHEVLMNSCDIYKDIYYSQLSTGSDPRRSARSGGEADVR